MFFVFHLFEKLTFQIIISGMTDFFKSDIFIQEIPKGIGIVKRNREELVLANFFSQVQSRGFINFQKNGNAWSNG